MTAPDHIRSTDPARPARAPMKRLTIEHNHGVCILKDVTWESYIHERTGAVCWIATGTVEGGGNASRLFSEVLFRPFPKGEMMQYDVWSRTPHPCSDIDDHWRVSVEFC